jgi:hypothetical protein
MFQCTIPDGGLCDRPDLGLHLALGTWPQFLVQGGPELQQLELSRTERKESATVDPPRQEKERREKRKLLTVGGDFERRANPSFSFYPPRPREKWVSL